MKSGVYAITNKVNGKRYIGSGAHVQGRINSHIHLLRAKKHPNRHLQMAFLKYGEESFVFSPLLWCSKSDALTYEQICIDGFDSVKTGYNLRPKAHSNTGIKMSPDAIAKFSERSKRMWMDAAYREAISEKRREYGADPKWRAKVSTAMKAALESSEMRARWSAAASLSQSRPSVKAKVGAASKRNWQDPAYRARLSEVRKAKWADPEFRAKVAKAQAVARARPGYRELVSVKSKAYWQRPGSKEKGSEFSRSNWQCDDYRSVISAKRKEQWANPESREKILRSRIGMCPWCGESLHPGRRCHNDDLSSGTRGTG